MSNLFSTGGAGNVGFSGEVQQSLKFNDDESQYLSWTPASAGNRKTWTWSGWVKRGNLGTWQTVFSGGTGSNHVAARFSNSTDLFQFYNYSSPSYNWKIDTVAVFRDASAWYHLVLQVDSTQATSTDRIKIYINGERQTLTGSYPSLNFDSDVNTAQPHKIGAGINNDLLFDGYMSDINFIDGQALDPTSFGETVDGYWKAKDYAGTYGTNGFRLTFQDDVVSEGFNTVTYRGTGASQSISGLGFSPDLVWTKARGGASSHNLSDSIRGGGVGLTSNGNNAEYALSPANTFDADGFTLNKTTSQFNSSGDTFVGWCWDAGSGSAASNTDGTITSTVKANTDYGFSVVSYTGTGSAATIGHGLSSAPDMIIAKRRSGTDDWVCYHSALSSAKDKYILLNSTNAAGTISNFWGTTAPDASTFGAAGGYAHNKSGSTYIAYCFSEVAGYSSIGSYTGNGSASGPTVTTGFKPAFVMYKKYDGTGSWIIQDSTRSPFNPVDKFLYGNTSDDEFSGTRDVDFLSNGFQIKSDSVNINQSGKNYIYMAFADTREAAFWKDVSGQGNHWTPNNLDYRDSLIDSPANNFAVLNALHPDADGLSEGNLKNYYAASSGSIHRGISTIAIPSSGKWYWELLSNSTDNEVAIIELSGNQKAGTYNTSAVANGSVLSFEADADAGTLTIYDDESQVSQTTSIDFSKQYMAYVGNDSTNTSTNSTANFGQDSTFSGATTAGGNQDDNGVGDFKYAPPSGYLALCTANLTTPTIVDGSEHFNTVLYTGDSTTGRAITGVGFQPDWLWIKERSSVSNHRILDVLRGLNRLKSNSTDAETIDSTGVQSFDIDGFTVDDNQDYNDSGETYAAWNWKAGGAAVSNTDGSITSQVSANVDAGFSIVSYTGTGANATVGHGLNSAPDMVIVKNRDESWAHWGVYHKDNGGANSGHLYSIALNLTGGAASSSTYWNNTAPTSSVFSIGTDGVINNSGSDNIAYCFANSDIIKAGSYTGNGSNDGPFIYLGFRPSLFLTKRTDSTSDWQLLDTARDTYNAADAYLKPNSSAGESTGGDHDFVSNGFKIRNSGGSQNASGGTYIYLAFAESPFKYANAR